MVRVGPRERSSTRMCEDGPLFLPSPAASIEGGVAIRVRVPASFVVLAALAAGAGACGGKGDPAAAATSPAGSASLSSASASVADAPAAHGATENGATPP